MLKENIRIFRMQRRLSQEAFGKLLGVTAQSVSKWELGLTSPDISLLPVIAECFGVTIDSLFTGEPTRRYPGYDGKRQELFAIYENEGGTEEDFQRAQEAYKEVILNGKAVANDYLAYGRLHRIRAIRDTEVALYYYRQAISEGNARRDLGWMAARQELTKLLFDLGRIEEAIEEQKKWSEEEPETAWAHVSFSYALELSGRLDEAWDEIKKALCLNPEDINVLTAAGDICAKIGLYDEAIGYWNRISKESTSISHLYSKAELLASIGEKESAIRQYEEILIWLEEHGFNVELEGIYPRRRINELSNL